MIFNHGWTQMDTDTERRRGCPPPLDVTRIRPSRSSRPKSSWNFIGRGEGDVPRRAWLFIRVHRCVSVVALILFFAASVPALEISWTNNLLSVTGANLPGGKLDVWYLEAFCRSGAHTQAWGQTTLPHKTTLVTNENNRVLRFRTLVQTNVEVTHVVTAGVDEIDFRFTLANHGAQDIDLQWFQPVCLGVEKFTGCWQSN